MTRTCLDCGVPTFRAGVTGRWPSRCPEHTRARIREQNAEHSRNYQADKKRPTMKQARGVIASAKPFISLWNDRKEEWAKAHDDDVVIAYGKGKRLRVGDFRRLVESVRG